MAKEEKDKKEEPKAKAKKKLHLHEIRSTQAHDGSIVHHHTYKDHKDAPFPHPERGPMATSETPDEAGQHVAEQFSMNQPGGQPGAAAEQEEQQVTPPQSTPAAPGAAASPAGVEEEA